MQTKNNVFPAKVIHLDIGCYQRLSFEKSIRYIPKPISKGSSFPFHQALYSEEKRLIHDLVRTSIELIKISECMLWFYIQISVF